MFELQLPRLCDHIWLFAFYAQICWIHSFLKTSSDSNLEKGEWR